MDDVLETQPRPYGLRDVESRPGIARPGSDIQEQGPVRSEHPGRGGDPGVRPLQVLSGRQRVLIPVVADAEIVWRRRHDDVDALGWQMVENLDAIAQIEPAGPASRGADDVVRFEKNGHTPYFRPGAVCSLMGHGTTGLWPHRDTRRRCLRAGLRRLGRQRKADSRHEAVGGDRVVAPMPVAPAGFALFFDVTDFAARRHFAIAADDAAARQRGEPEKSHKAHNGPLYS